ncbi:MAG: ATP-binding protein [Anaerolineae bacterium]
MKQHNPGFRTNKNLCLTLALLLAILITGALFIWWTVQRVDREMRANLLHQARLVALTVNPENVQALSGSEADLNSPIYHLLKQQLIVIHSANPLCRFVYLLGRKADGTVFFFMDSELADSKDYSPPGQVYYEVTEGDLQVFDNKIAAVTGPTTDRWGTWVSALVPLTNPQTGGVVSVLGMDLDAGNWNWDVAAQAALPVALLVILLIVVVVIFVSTRRVDSSPKPVLWRLLPSLTIILILLIVGAGAILYQQHHEQLDDEITADIAHVSGDLYAALDQQAVGLATTAKSIAADPGVQRALREGDVDSLFTDWQPVFEILQLENQLTHFYFIDKNRIVLLRIHDPERRGDLINRFTALEAERTGKSASGIELGPLGTFTMRLVQPVFENGVLVGYVELGKEIEDALQSVHTRSGNQIAVVIRKEFLNEQTWEEGIRLLGRVPDWDRLARSVVVYASQGRLPDAFASWANQFADNSVHAETDQEIVYDGKDWRVSSTPLQDASGKNVGNLLVMRDITAAHAVFARLQVLGGTAGAVLLALLLGIIYVLLRRTDAGIRAQQAALRESENKYRMLIDNANESIVVEQDGLLKFFNTAAHGLLQSYTQHELFNRPFSGFLHPDDRTMVNEYYRQRIAHEVEQSRLIFRVVTYGGVTKWVEVNVALIEWQGKQATLNFLTDITERRRAEGALHESEQREYQTKLSEQQRRLEIEEQAAQALREKAEELARSNKELQQFAYVASHDLQEPLRMVVSYTQLLAERYSGKLDEKADKYINYAVEGATRIQRLILDLLAYSRVGTRAKPFEQTDCSELVREAIQNLGKTVKESGAEVIVGDLPMVLADRAQLKQVFEHLIANAVKFKSDAPPRVVISAQQKSGNWEFCIADNGIGIDPQFCDRIFIIFQRLHERGKYEGSGMGLAICKKIVERLGGYIWAESEPGVGSRFLFTIPVSTSLGNSYTI